jgi:hypothetical protein
MRALQERRTLLGDMAAQQRALERGEDARKLEAIAERLEGQITVLRSLLEEAPPPLE